MGSTNQVIELLRGEDFEHALANQISSAVDNSELHRSLQSYSAKSGAEMAMIATALGLATDKICALLASSNEHLSKIESLIANPGMTASLEHARRGAHCLQRGWLPEARAEFASAIGRSPYHPLWYFYLGLAEASEGALLASDAERNFGRAARYSLPDFPDLHAGSILLQANLLERIGRVDKAVELLDAELDRHRLCAELQLLHARLTGSQGSLLTSLAVAPEFARVAEGWSDVQLEDLQFDRGVHPISIAELLARAVAKFADTLPTSLRLNLRSELPAGFGSDWRRSSITAWIDAGEVLAFVRVNFATLANYRRQAISLEDSVVSAAAQTPGYGEDWVTYVAQLKTSIQDHSALVGEGETTPRHVGGAIEQLRGLRNAALTEIYSLKPSLEREHPAEATIDFSSVEPRNG